MRNAYYLVIGCGVLALLYGWVTSRQVLSANAGTARMQEISGAVQLGARAYLNRQYRTVAIVGVVILIVLGIAIATRSPSATPSTIRMTTPTIATVRYWRLR